MATIPILNSVQHLSRSHAVWLVDIWGVIHNGVRPFEMTIRTLARHRENGGTVILITNAPRPALAVAEQLADLGVRRDAFDAIVTSGDVTKSLLAAEGAKRTYHIGPARDVGLFAGLSLERCEAGRAELILCSGLFDDTTETPVDYKAALINLAARGVPMICANPDLRVERGHQIVPCAGAVAQLYATLGGAVAYAGKPYAPIYDLARTTAQPILGRIPAATDILCIGDGLSTDIRGAHEQGLDVLFVGSGVDLPGGFSAATVNALFAGTPYKPIGAQAQLTW